MMKFLRLAVAAIVVAFSGHAQAQTGFGQIPEFNLLGNPTGSIAPPVAATLPQLSTQYFPHLSSNVEGTGFPGMDGASGGVNFFLWNAPILGGALDSAPTLRVDRNPTGSSTCAIISPPTPCGSVAVITVNANAPLNDAWSEFGVAVTLNNRSTVPLIQGFPNNVALIGFSNKLGSNVDVVPTWGLNTYCIDQTGFNNPTRGCTGAEVDVGCSVACGNDNNQQRIGLQIGAFGAPGPTVISKTLTIGATTGVRVVKGITLDVTGGGFFTVGYDTASATVNNASLFMAASQPIVFDGSWSVNTPSYTKSLLVSGTTLIYQTSSSGSGAASLFQITAAGQMNLTGTANIGGNLILNGASSGALTQAVQAAAGTPTVTWGTGSGTPAVTATSPLAINTSTGNITCTTCLTPSTGVTTFSGGTTGLTPNTPTSGAIVLAGILVVQNGGTGQSSLTANAFLTGNGTSAINQVAITGLVVGNGASAPTGYAGVTCTNQFLTALSASGAGTCTTDVLASAQHANQGTTTTVLHGNAAGNPSWAAISLTVDVSGTLPVGNGGTACSVASITCFNNITGFTAAGTTGTTSTNLVFSTSPTFAGTVTMPDSSTWTSNGPSAITQTLTTTTTNTMTATGAGSTLTWTFTNSTNGRTAIFGNNSFNAYINSTGGGDVIFQIAGAAKIDISSTTANVVNAGTAAAPPLSIGNSTTGLYSVSTTGLGFSVNGASVADSAITTLGTWTFSGAIGANGGLTFASANTGFLNTLLMQNTGTSTNTSTFAIIKAALANVSTQYIQMYIQGGAVPTGVISSSVNTLAFTAAANMSFNPDGTLRLDYAQTTAATWTFATAVTINNATFKVTTLANSATTSAACYAPATGLFTYGGTIGTCTVSDETLKAFEGPVDNALGRLVALSRSPAFGYFRASDAGRAQFGTERRIGLGAQTLGSFFPELMERGVDGLYSADYAKLTVPIVAALVEVHDEVSELRSRVTSLEAANDNLSREVETLKTGTRL